MSEKKRKILRQENVLNGLARPKRRVEFIHITSSWVNICQISIPNTRKHSAAVMAATATVRVLTVCTQRNTRWTNSSLEKAAGKKYQKDPQPTSQPTEWKQNPRQPRWRRHHSQRANKTKTNKRINKHKINSKINDFILKFARIVSRHFHKLQADRVQRNKLIVSTSYPIKSE